MIKRFLKDKKGNFALMCGIMAIPFMLAAGIAVDYGNMVRTRSQLQNALDGAAMQMAYKVSSGMTDAEIEAFGQKTLVANMATYISSSSNLPVLHYFGVSTEPDGSQVLKATASYSYQLLFMEAAFSGGPGTRTISTESDVRSKAGDPACVYALNHTAQRAIDVSGGANIGMDGCVIASNSNDDQSIYASGSSHISTDCAQAAGQIDTGASMTTKCSHVREDAWVLSDPFRDIPEPDRPVSLNSDPKLKDTTMNPGRYEDLILDGTKHMNPGVYYIEGDLTIHGDITGSGVFIYMADGTLLVNGDASLSLQAPTKDDIANNPSLGLDAYGGMLFMNARDNYNPMTFNGAGQTQLDGYVYSAGGQVFYSGDNGTTSTCLRIVADTIDLTGNTHMKSNCDFALADRVASTAGDFYYSK